MPSATGDFFKLAYAGSCNSDQIVIQLLFCVRVTYLTGRVIDWHYYIPGTCSMGAIIHRKRASELEAEERRWMLYELVPALCRMSRIWDKLVRGAERGWFYRRITSSPKMAGHPKKVKSVEFLPWKKESFVHRNNWRERRS